MRFFFLLILLAGIAGIVYPRIAAGLADDQIGVWRVYVPDTGFQAVEIPLDPASAPVRVVVELGVATSFTPSETETVLTLTASSANGTALAKTLTFFGSGAIAESPQTLASRYREVAGVIDPVKGGLHKFVIGAGDAESVEFRTVDLILQSNAFDVDPRMQPIGFALMTIGFVGFVLAFVRKRRRSARPGPDTSEHRWGRRSD